MEAVGEEPILAPESFVAPAVSDEEIQRLTVSDSLTDIEKAQLYVAGEPFQQRFLAENLAGLVQGSGPAALSALSSQLEGLANALDGDGQEVLARGLAHIMRKRLLGPTQVVDLVLPIVLSHAVELSSLIELGEAWEECFGSLVMVLDRQTLHSRVLPAVLALAGSGATHSVPSRCLCSRVVALLAPALPPEAVEGRLLSLVLSLCQDVDFEVRSAMCQGLPHVVRALTGRAAAIDKVADELLMLLDDEEVPVRAVAWQSLADILQQASGPDSSGYALTRPARRAVLATFLQHCRLPDPHVELHRSLAAVFGTLVARLVADMDGDTDVNTCLSGFRNLAWRHDAPTRLSCAAGFLAVLKAANPRRYASHLHDTLVRLAADPDATVRQEVANTFHEVLDLLGKERCVQYLRPTLLGLLADESRGVVSVLAANLGKVLEQYHLPFNQALSSKVFGELLEPLLKLELNSGHNWRLQLGFLRAVAELPKYYPPDIAYDKFLPVVLRYMAGGAAALLSDAAEAAAAIWQSPYVKPEHRTALYGRLILEFAQGQSWRQRAVFLDFCGHALRRFSSSFYKAYLMDASTLLAYDPVPIIRLRVCSLLPRLKQAISLPEDVLYLGRMNAAMQHLLMDNDHDTAEAARLASQDFKGQAVQMPGDAVAAAAAGQYWQDAEKRQVEKAYVWDQEALSRIQAEREAHDKALRPPLVSALPLDQHLRGSDGSKHSSPQTSARKAAGGAVTATAGVGAVAGSSQVHSASFGSMPAKSPHRRAGNDVDSSQAGPHRAGLSIRKTFDPDARWPPRESSDSGNKTSHAGPRRHSPPARLRHGGLTISKDQQAAQRRATSTGVAVSVPAGAVHNSTAAGAVSGLASASRRVTSTGVAGRSPTVNISASAASQCTPEPRRATTTGVTSPTKGSMAAGKAGSGILNQGALKASGSPRSGGSTSNLGGKTSVQPIKPPGNA